MSFELFFIILPEKNNKYINYSRKKCHKQIIRVEEKNYKQLK